MLSLLTGKHLIILGVVFIYSSPWLFSQTDTANIDDNETVQVTEKEMTKSPLGAVWRTFVVPGWGQIYVEKYWKAPIFFAGAGALVYSIIWNNSKFSDYQSQYDRIKLEDPQNLSALSLLNRQKEYYRDNRDRSYFFLAVVYLVAAMDAYVGAHLFDFDVSDKLAIQISPFYQNQPKLGFSIIFK